MGQQWLVYFKNENDAVSAETSLQRLAVNQSRVEEIPEAGDKRVLIPIVNAGGGGGTAAGGVLGGMPVSEDKKDDDAPFTHVLTFELDDAHAREAASVLKDSNGYIDEETSSRFS